ncbi:MAG: hypothetical protein IPH69_01740 [Bacteroidales bacterium]|nr:hypothetical protein [Bacteroidales bacterium]
MKKIYSISVVCLMVAAFVSCTGGKDIKPQPALGTRSVSIIEKEVLNSKILTKMEISTSTRTGD